MNKSNICQLNNQGHPVKCPKCGGIKWARYGLNEYRCINCAYGLTLWYTPRKPKKPVVVRAGKGRPKQNGNESGNN